MKNNESKSRYTTKVIDSGTVVFGSKGEWIQKFSTETEADEFVAGRVKSEELENNE